MEIAILEVGLGGRLDATNIVEPILSVITDIALDHQEYLGETMAEIAREKAGILRARGTLVTLPQHAEANRSIAEAVAMNARVIDAAEFLPGRSFQAGLDRAGVNRPCYAPTTTKFCSMASDCGCALRWPANTTA